MALWRGPVRYPLYGMVIDMDEYINRLHKAEKEEWDLFFNFKHGGEWPDPPSYRLWFDGLAKFGKPFPMREYELRKTKSTAE